MILDEIQCGMGRTGKMFAYDYYDVKPNILTVAKALGCGVANWRLCCRRKVEKALLAGDHGSTYGGNPLALQQPRMQYLICLKAVTSLTMSTKVGDYLGEKIGIIS